MNVIHGAGGDAGGRGNQHRGLSREDEAGCAAALRPHHQRARPAPPHTFLRSRSCRVRESTGLLYYLSDLRFCFYS